MSNPELMNQILTDRPALSRYRRRVKKSEGRLLREEAASELRERLDLVNRSFSSPVIVSAHPKFWKDAFNGDKSLKDGELHDIEAGAHDLAVHAMCLHWANDPVGQLIQMKRALRPDGLFLGICPGGQTMSELRSCLAQAEMEITGGMSPRVAPMAEIRDLGSLLQRAGFALPVADSITRRLSYSSPLHLVHDIRKTGESNALESRLRHFTRRGIFDRAFDLYLENYGDDTGGIYATLEIIVLTGWSPHPGQPQPLAPGSASVGLANALSGKKSPTSN